MRPWDRHDYFGPAKGDWRGRAYVAAEEPVPAWGPRTGDLYINDRVHVANVPQAVWSYELGGYPVHKKWLGYRQTSRTGGQPVTLPEARHLRSIVHRLGALLILHARLDDLYEQVGADAFSAEDLGLRT